MKFPLVSCRKDSFKSIFHGQSNRYNERNVFIFQQRFLSTTYHLESSIQGYFVGDINQFKCEVYFLAGPVILSYHPNSINNFLVLLQTFERLSTSQDLAFVVWIKNSDLF